MIVGVCVITFTLIELFQDQLVYLFSRDPEVLYWCKKILKIALCFLFFDGLQCACVGVLKGLKDTKIIMFTMLFAYLSELHNHYHNNKQVDTKQCQNLQKKPFPTNKQPEHNL